MARAARLWLCLGFAPLLGCAVDETAGTKNSSSIADAGTQASEAGPAPRGAGMPIVPIHRADAGAKTHADAGAKTYADAMPMDMDDQQADAAPVTTVVIDAGEVDAGRNAMPSNPQTDAGAMPPSAAALPQPIHRYSFSGAGKSVPDAQGGKDALIKGDAQLDGHDAVEFTSNGDGLVELPNETFAEVSDFSVLVWLSASSDACWQRAFDLTSVQQAATPAGGPGTGQGPGPATTVTRSELVSLYLTPFGCPDKLPTLGYVTSNSKYHLTGKDPVAQDEEVLLGLTYSARSQALRLIVDGEVINEQRVLLDLHALHRARAWLGHSYSASDPVLDGSISELRVYASALEASTLAELNARGPDQL